MVGRNEPQGVEYLPLHVWHHYSAERSDPENIGITRAIRTHARHHVVCT
jgi:hypothetical protein